MTEKEIRDVCDEIGIWLDDDMSGEYDNGKGFKFYIRFNETEEKGKWDMVRHLSTLPELTDCSEYCADMFFKDKQSLIDALESSISLPIKLFYFLSSF